MSLSSLLPRKEPLVIVGVLALLAVVASSPLSFTSWFDSSDHVVHLIRSNDVCHEISTGDFYPRWLSQSCYGKGSPTLNFYAPAFYLLVGYLNTLGIPIVAAMTLVCGASFFVSGWGMFIWTRKHCGDWGAAVAATLYMFAPYHFANLYQRGGLPEFVAMALLPFLLHGIDLSLSPESRFRGTIATSVATAAIILTHNLSAMMIAPFAFGYFIWGCADHRPSWKQIAGACAGPVLGAGLAAFYVVPVAMETKYLLFLEKITSGVFHYARNFIHIKTFFTSTPFNIYNFHRMYVLMGLCAAAALVVVSRKGARSGFGYTAALLSLLSFFMTLPLSSVIYEAIHAFQYVQFPWRFLGTSTLFLAALCGVAFRWKPLRERQTLGMASAAVVIAVILFLSADLRKVQEKLPDLPSQPIAFSRTAPPIFFKWSESDYMPVFSRLYKRDFVDYPMLFDGITAMPLANCSRNGSHLVCNISLGTPATLVAPWLYFPGWKATSGGRELATYPDENGLVAAVVPAGEQTVDIWFGTTAPRIVGWVVTGISMAIVLSLVFFRILARRAGQGGHTSSQ